MARLSHRDNRHSTWTWPLAVEMRPTWESPGIWHFEELDSFEAGIEGRQIQTSLGLVLHDRSGQQPFAFVTASLRAWVWTDDAEINLELEVDSVWTDPGCRRLGLAQLLRQALLTEVEDILYKLSVGRRGIWAQKLDVVGNVYSHGGEWFVCELGKDCANLWEGPGLETGWTIDRVEYDPRW